MAMWCRLAPVAKYAIYMQDQIYTMNFVLETCHNIATVKTMAWCSYLLISMFKKKKRGELKAYVR